MIGLLFFVALFGYILLAKFIINRAYKIYKTQKAKNIALVIMILIPTWDVILGFPIYAYLCMFESGTKIYKTVDKVEGFYVGKKSLSNEPIEPYKGYKFIEYKSMNFSRTTEKYYRSYWAEYWYDKKIAGMCVYPLYPNNAEHSYTKVFNKGKCIVKEEIAESEVTNLWKISKKVIKDYSILYLDITSIEIEVIDQRTKKKYFTATNYIVDKSWVTGMNISSGKTGRKSCNKLYKYYGDDINELFIIDTLIQKKEK